MQTKTIGAFDGVREDAKFGQLAMLVERAPNVLEGPPVTVSRRNHQDKTGRHLFAETPKAKLEW
jgi:hypothetical protein